MAEKKRFDSEGRAKQMENKGSAAISSRTDGGRIFPTRKGEREIATSACFESLLTAVLSTVPYQHTQPIAPISYLSPTMDVFRVEIAGDDDDKVPATTTAVHNETITNAAADKASSDTSAGGGAEGHHR